MTQKYPRDLAGYGASPPDPQWPGGARIAVQLVLNYEEGGENSVLHGDAASEAFLSEINGYRWIDYQYVDENTERAHMRQAIQAIENTTGERPLGWYTGRSSPNTRRLVVEEGGFLYDADDYNDDLPFWDHQHGRPHLVIPYTLDVNDMRFATSQGFNSGEQFYQYLKDSFDVLYAEGRRTPRMMSVGLHCRLAGRPGRFAALEQFLRYARSFDDVWWCRRIDIARHWHEKHSREVW
jgi:peptidoglycan/xylan/chitin deacetylase (PgdA/CDA1 family)